MRGWVRIGIVLSVLWFFGFGWWLRQADFDNARMTAGYDTCSIIYNMHRDAPVHSNPPLDRVVKEFDNCLERVGARFMRVASPMWGIIVVDALSLALLWLVAWMVVAVGRWVKAGFRQQA
jgi:hypothetical protein